MDYIRSWTRSFFLSYHTKHDEHIKEVAACLDEGVEGADYRKQVIANQSEDYFSTRVNHFPKLPRNFKSQVDAHEEEGHFVNPWQAMYEVKHGTMYRVGHLQHVKCRRETYWTRQRAALNAQAVSD